MKIILCGGPESPATEILKWVVANKQPSDIYIFTHSPRGWPKGGDVLQNIASNLGIGVSIASINDVQLPFEPDVTISIYYRYIIKQRVIDQCGKIFNAHTALLPRNRGCSAIPWAIINDDKWTGVTYHYIDKGIDTGPIILQAGVQIADDETQTSLFEKVDQAVIDYFPAALELVLAGWPGVEQKGPATYYPAGLPHEGDIDPNWPWGKIMRFIRAMTYPPLRPATFENIEIRDEDDYREAMYLRHLRKMREREEAKSA